MPTGTPGEIVVFADVDIYTPDHLGRGDVTIIGSQIAHVGGASPFVGMAGTRVHSASGLLAFPGFVDGHIHLQGGSAMAGPASLPAPLPASDLLAGGITSAVAAQGGDVISRSPEATLLRVRALASGGVSGYMYTGGFGYPPPTITGGIDRDIALLPEVVGVKLAVGDASTGRLTPHEFARAVGEAIVGARVAGKPTVVHVHLGERGDTVDWLERRVTAGVPRESLILTHANRSADTLERATAYALQGGYLDLTGAQSAAAGQPSAVEPADAVAQLVTAGVPLPQLTFSSDAGAVRPGFRDAQEGQLRPWMFLPQLSEMNRSHGLALESVIPLLTRNVAVRLGLGDAGRIHPGVSANLLLVSADLSKVRVAVSRGAVVYDPEFLIAAQ